MILASFVIVALCLSAGVHSDGLLLVKLFRHEDIRSVGSGNIGATNVLRSGGKGLGAATFLLDVLKGAAAVWLGSLLASVLLPSMPFREAQALAAVSAVLGHMFPVWLRFRGGKGVSTGFGVFLVAAPLGGVGCYSAVCGGPVVQPIRFACLDSCRCELSRICVVPGARRETRTVHRCANLRRAADHPQASPEHSPPRYRD